MDPLLDGCAYSVLLLQPDFVADQYGEGTDYLHVRAGTPAAAIALAQRQAARQAAELHECDDDPHAFLPLLCVEGHHTNLVTP